MSPKTDYAQRAQPTYPALLAIDAPLKIANGVSALLLTLTEC